ncbi:MAG: hypothetical protein OXU20_11695, partial [Myxococcales bacterium]|nr:hypothetical protein [Myxococcales bacterium]
MSVTLVPDGLKVQFWNAGPDGENWQALEFLGAPPAQGAWQHVAVTYDSFPGSFGGSPGPAEIPSSPAIQVFVDGVGATRMGTRTESGQPSHPHGPRPSPVGQLDLGGFADGRHTWFSGRFRPLLNPSGSLAPTDPANHRYGGELSELRLWTVVRSAAELDRDRHRSVPVVPELSLYMPLRDLVAGQNVSPLADLAGGQHQNRHTARLQAHHIALYRVDAGDLGPELLSAHTEYDGAGAQLWRNYTYEGEFSYRPDATTSAGGSAGGPSAIGLVVLSQRAAGHDRYYRLSNDGPDDAWHFVANPRGALPSTGGPLPTPSADVVYRFKLRVSHAAPGDQVALEAKVWSRTEAEPADYQLRATDDDVDFAIASGTVGVWTPGRDAAGWVLDNLKVEVATSSGLQAARFDFEASPVPLPPADWHQSNDTQAPPPANGLTEPLARQPEAPPAVRFRSDDQNVHSCYAPASLHSEVLASKDYEFAGRMRLVDAAEGAGITFLDRSPSGQQHYYSLRTTPERPRFHLVRVPAAIDALKPADGGAVESQLQPELGTWYEFRVRARDLGSHTDIQAMIWASGTTPPATFELHAIDTSSQRLAAGTVGVWNSGAGHPEFENLRLLGDELLSEDFQSTAEGDFPAAWQETVPGEPDHGTADREFAAARQGDASVLRCERPDDRTYARYAPTGDGAPDPSAWTSYTYSGRLRYDRSATFPRPPFVGVTVLTQSAGQGSHYSLRINGDERFEFARVEDGSRGDELEGTAATRLRAETNVWYRYRIEVDVRPDDTQLRAKIWRDGQVEPDGYALLAVDEDSERYRSGTVGVWVSRRASGDFDDLRVQ